MHLRIPKLTLAAPPQADSGAVAEARAAPGRRRQVRCSSPIAPPARRPAWSGSSSSPSSAGVGRQHAAEHAAADRRRADEFPVAPSAQPDAAQRAPRSPKATSSSASRSRTSSARPTPTATRSSAARRRPRRAGAKLVTITAGELNTKANYQDFQRYAEVDLALAGDAEATLPSLIEAVKRLITDDRRRAFEERGARLAEREPDRQGARARRCDLRVGRGPDQQRAPCGGSLGAGPAGRLVARERRAQRMAAAPVEFREVLSVHRRLGRIGHRLRRAGGRGRRARQPQVRPAVDQPAERRRPDVRAGRAVDGGPPQDSDSVRHEQQPRVSRGGHASAAHGRTAASAASIARTSGRRSTTPRSTSRSSRRAWACTRKVRSPIPEDLAPAIKRAIATVKSGEPALVDVVTQPR